MKHPGHTYGGFVNTISERGMTDYEDFQMMVDKATIVENKIKEMEKNGKRKMLFPG
jgi:hypothetical protein